MGQVHVCVPGRLFYLGLYDDLDDAAAVAEAGRALLHAPNPAYDGTSDPAEVRAAARQIAGLALL